MDSFISSAEPDNFASSQYSTKCQLRALRAEI